MFYTYLIILAVMGLITFVSYANDKRKATKDPKHRTREKTLLLLSFIFGSIGGLLGMYKCHHKTKHWYFVFVNWFSLILHIAIGIIVFKYFGFSGFVLL